jgi:hypothetical protein
MQGYFIGEYRPCCPSINVYSISQVCNDDDGFDNAPASARRGEGGAAPPASTSILLAPNLHIHRLLSSLSLAQFRSECRCSSESPVNGSGLMQEAIFVSARTRTKLNKFDCRTLALCRSLGQNVKLTSSE